MTIGALKQILAPLNDEGEVFIDADESEEIVALVSAQLDDEGDLILSDCEEEAEEEADDETDD